MFNFFFNVIINNKGIIYIFIYQSIIISLDDSQPHIFLYQRYRNGLCLPLASRPGNSTHDNETTNALAM